jgi:3-dehydroquinate synthase
MATGKSRVGRALAARLGRPFVDTDELLVARFGMPIGDYFRQAGEPAFRDAESEVLQAACAGRQQIISLGGGAIVRPENLAAAKRGNLLVRLAASPETIYARLMAEPGAAERPMLAGADPKARIAQLLADRAPIYSQAHATVVTDGKSVDELVEEIVSLAEAETLHVEAGLASRIGELLRDIGVGGRAFLVSNETIMPLHGEKLMRSLEAAGYRPAARVVPDHESYKSLATATELYGWLANERAERTDVVVALGGGMVGDLAGFAAATYLRGLAVVQVPTTLLAQVDSAIGGKTAVNLDVGKNLIGAWHMPRAIVVDPTLLTTLPRRDVVSGWTETIKHALIMDRSLLETIEANVDALLGLEMDITTEVVARSARLKVDVVAKDPREQNLRMILNYGHTLGHAIEAASDYRLLHGEAVAIGMRAAARIGRGMGVTPLELEERQARLIARFGLPTHGGAIDRDRAFRALRLDKKVEGQTNRWVLLEDVARPVIRRDVPGELVEDALTAVVD